MTILDTLAHVPAMGFINAALSFALTAIVIHMLFCYAHIYNLAERIGHGLAGSAMLISAFKQLGFAYLVSPFEPTYQMLWRVGWLLLLTGKLWRLHKHARANRQHEQEALVRLRAKGIILPD